MKTAENNIYSAIQQLNQIVKENLKDKGIVVPIQQRDGSIRLGLYKIRKVATGFYNIEDYKNNLVVEGINLPQTAIILANKLALGKWLDKELLLLDKRYGYALFDELAHERSSLTNYRKKDYEKAEIMKIKSIVANRKKQLFKKAIIGDYKKLIAF